ncbi:SOS response-associated peptidase family protein [Dyella sp. 2HG41-7]|uniref:SOS response-associated peptidase family protein n=1 Tax=Dyella sp. 2HG41-7 TaxID=2883239 RepID=UPI001F1CE2D7|nr:SOS response-associated peptidase family protein [Dyella sp. 2HG41-7]
MIYADFRKYEHHGGKLDIKAFVKMFWERKKSGDWVKKVPKAMRDSFADPRTPDEAEANAVAIEAYRSAALVYEKEVAEQTERKVKAETVLAGAKPTKKAANDVRVATNKIAAAEAKLRELNDQSKTDGYGRIWPGSYCPVLMRDHATGERMIVPMRYRCRLPGWSAQDEVEKPGTYNARRDKLSTVWKKLFGYNHGVVIASKFYESVSLHRLHQRELAPGERDIAVEIRFEAEPKQDLFLACLWRYVEDTDDGPGFYSFAIITRDPPPEVLAAGHDRCVVAIKPENLDAWLAPDPHHLNAMFEIIDTPPDVYYQHELVSDKAEAV